MRYETLVRYETRGENYDPYGSEEEDLLVRLQDAGYLVLEVGGDSTLVYGPNVERSAALAKWANIHFSLTCYVCSKTVAPSDPRAFGEAVGKGSDQWRGTLKDQEILKQNASIMRWPGCTWCCTDCYWTQATLGKDAARQPEAPTTPQKRRR